MEYHNKEFCLEVWGDYACFTRPEMKVERVSYDVMTPSAARSIFEAIFWKPAIRWKVTRIEVLNPIEWISIRRNEVGSLMSPRSEHLFIEDLRQQRAGLLLRDVRYRIYAELEFIPFRERKSLKNNKSSWENTEESELEKMDENPGKYNAMFERRAKKGQCFNQPYLGCREFSANFSLIENPIKSNGIAETRDLGFMLYDMDFSNPVNPQAMFFRAKLENGIIEVPSKESEEVRK
ncbi:MAG: type I-C CRISPR-associated protein Cas5c [Bacteroidales bacterium]